MFDYLAVPYPWGMQLAMEVQMFNARQVVSVEYNGYLDEDGKMYTEKMPEFIAICKDKLKAHQESSLQSDNKVAP